jgi:hypothetical protein
MTETTKIIKFDLQNYAVPKILYISNYRSINFKICFATNIAGSMGNR